jgi:hypothetical protein
VCSSDILLLIQWGWEWSIRMSAPTELWKTANKTQNPLRRLEITNRLNTTYQTELNIIRFFQFCTVMSDASTLQVSYDRI